MRKLIVFNQVSLDGYFTDANGDMSWAHRDSSDREWKSFVDANASSGGQLLFGRITGNVYLCYEPATAGGAK